MSYLINIRKSIEGAIQQGLLSTDTGVLTGYSGKKIIGMLQRLAKNTLTSDTVYLEVGVFQGLTLLSVAKEIGEKIAYGVDNFAYFDEEGKNQKIVEDRMRRLGLSNAFIINEDYEDALENLDEKIGEKKVGVYFVDGPHDYRSQAMCLALIKPFLADEAVIVVDDCNYRHVRQANRDFLLTNPDYKLVFESYTGVHPNCLTEAQRSDHADGWWNGVNVIVKDTRNDLISVYPETHKDRTLYENEHIIHSTKHPEAILPLLKLTNILAPIVYSFGKMKGRKQFMIGRFDSMNVYAEKLPEQKFNDSLPNNL